MSLVQEQPEVLWGGVRFGDIPAHNDLRLDCAPGQDPQDHQGHARELWQAVGLLDG